MIHVLEGTPAPCRLAEQQRALLVRAGGHEDRRQKSNVLLVLSEASIASEWVEDEIDKAFKEERQRGRWCCFRCGWTTL